MFSLVIKKFIERTKISFPGSSVNDNDDVFILVSFTSIAILFLVIAFSQNQKHARKPVKTNSSCRALATCKLQTSLVQPDNHVVQKFDTRKIYKLSNEVIFFAPFFVCFSLFKFRHATHSQGFAYLLALSLRCARFCLYVLSKNQYDFTFA